MELLFLAGAVIAAFVVLKIFFKAVSLAIKLFVYGSIVIAILILWRVYVH